MPLEADLKLRQARSLRGIQSHLKTVRAALGDMRAIDVTPETVDGYIEARLSENEPPAPATVNRETGLLKQAFKLAIERQRISAAPKIRKLPERNARQGLWDKGDFDEMVKHLPEHLQGFAKFAYHSGWRKGEISSLEWADVDMAAKVIQLRPETQKRTRGACWLWKVNCGR
jgi:integrase